MIFVDSKVCNGCGTCIQFCPTNAIGLQNNLAFIDQDLCTGCAACMDACPQGAVLIGEIVPVEQDSTDLVATNAIPTSAVADPSRSITWREAVVSMLLWTSREIAPRLANLAVDFLEQRMSSMVTNQYHQNVSMAGQTPRARNGTGRQRRQRRRQRQFR
jgi:Fe-S-cluster-containing hydrogenase component 2